MANSDSADFYLINHFSFYTLTPLTAEGKSWAAENLNGAQRLGNNIYIESRYLQPILEGIANDSLTYS